MLPLQGAWVRSPWPGNWGPTCRKVRPPPTETKQTTVRCHYTPRIKTSAGEDVERPPLIHCLRECKMVQPVWKPVRQFLIKLPYDSAIPFLGIYCRELKTFFTQNLYISVYSKSIHNCQKLEIVQMSFVGWMDKQTVFRRTAEHCSSVKENKLSTRRVTWMNFSFRGTMLKEGSWFHKLISRMSPFTGHPQEIMTIVTQSRRVLGIRSGVASGWQGWGRRSSSASRLWRWLYKSIRVLAFIELYTKKSPFYCVINF